nr:DeoR/GlpR family DNA-binding transcription regulator [Lysinibacillus timonensis]
MFPEERQLQIVKVLNARGNVKVAQLSKRFNVTVETIRRDLEKLELENKLKRTHGGAIAIDNGDDDEIPFNDRTVLNKEEKMSVAKEAITLINERDIIFLDASSTSFYLAKGLPNLELTVITNSLLVAYELSNRSNIQVVMTGGNLTKSSLSLVGPNVTRTIQYYHINKMFFSCKGFDKDWGISDSNELQGAVKRSVMEMAEEKILLIDYSKVNKRSFVFIENKNILDYLIVDKKADRQYLQDLQTENIKLLVCE